MLKQLSIQSFKGPYTVDFFSSVKDVLACLPSEKEALFIIDKNIKKYHPEFCQSIEYNTLWKVYYIEATEENKNLSNIPQVIEEAVLKNEISRDKTLIAIGGGITQDITCFLAANLYRGMDWYFVPTTLLAQADSCIGSKSSINFKGWKNLLGSFTPPKSIYITPEFLSTLPKKDINSGLGEMIKLHIVSGKEDFKTIQDNFESILSDPVSMLSFIQKTLLIKQKYIEEDEFDKGIRNILNFGHSFGHAIESATHFGIPHGIAVTVGMDFANYIAWKYNRITESDYKFYSRLLRVNSTEFFNYPVEFESFFSALSKDKKNVGAQLSLILLDHDCLLKRVRFEKTEEFKSHCLYYLNQFRNETI